MQQLRRAQHVVNVLARHGFGDALSRIRVWECIHIRRGILRQACPFPEMTVPERLRAALEELGPTFVKLGQVLGTRSDLLPSEYTNELKKLQESVHFVPTEVIRAVIETELGRPINEVFDGFDDTPVAAASLAQVHRAVLKGKPVALKVQRPGIVEQIAVDLEIARRLAATAERYWPDLRPLNPGGFVNEFAEQMNKELDFVAEANNMKRFARNFEGDDRVRVPQVYPMYSTKRLITMEYLEGINIGDTQRLTQEGYDLQLIARRGAEIALKATFEHGFFHADPHPGNISVLPGNVIGVVDFGMMASLSQRDRDRLARLLYFISVGNDRRVARALNEIMESENDIPAEKLEPAMAALINQYSEAAAREMQLASMLFDMMRTIVANGGKLRPQLLWLAKGIAIQEDISRRLGAEYSMVDLGRPAARRVLSRKLNPFRQARESLFWLSDFVESAQDIPYDFSIILREIRKGLLKVEFEHLGLEPMRRTLSLAANRLSLSIMVAALLISSSVIALAKVPPLVGEMPVIGLTGYVLAGIMGIGLMLSILLQSGGHQK